MDVYTKYELMKVTVIMPDTKIHIEGEKSREELLNRAKEMFEAKYNIFHLKNGTYIAVKKELLTK